MSLSDLQCCCSPYVTAECNECPSSPRYVTRRDIEIDHKRQSMRRDDYVRGANDALEMVQLGLDRGCTPDVALVIARLGLGA